MKVCGEKFQPETARFYASTAAVCRAMARWPMLRLVDGAKRSVCGNHQRVLRKRGWVVIAQRWSP